MQIIDFTYDTIFLHSDTLLLSLIAVDLDGAEGSTNVKYGKPNPAQEQCSAIDLDICPDLLLAAIAAAGAVALVALYIALTMNTMGRRKRRRSLGDNAPQRSSNGLQEVSQILIIGNKQMDRS